jgi:hypothetical protein
VFTGGDGVEGEITHHGEITLSVPTRGGHVFASSDGVEGEITHTRRPCAQEW